MSRTLEHLKNLDIHLVGIGGVGMAGLARLLQERGNRVTGSDLEQGPSAKRLQALGIPVQWGHDAEHLPASCDLLIYSTAVRSSNPEREAATARGIPERQRGVVLAQLVNERKTTVAVAGTHGKTTTSSMLASCLRRAFLEPGWFIGAELQNDAPLATWGSEDDPLVVEADESDGTLVHYRPTIGVITNMDYDHMEFFNNEDDFIQCFQRFADQSETVVLPIGDGLHHRLKIPPEKCVRYDLQGRSWNLPIGGVHNQYNAEAAQVAATLLGASAAHLDEGLQSFWLPRRRYECLAQVSGRTVISDYAHHPAELQAVLRQAALLETGSFRVVFQPHRYTRTRTLLKEFPPALAGLESREILLCPVYAASEDPLEGGTTADVFGACKAQGLAHTRCFDSLEDCWRHIQKDWPEGETLLILGAGDVERIGFWAADWLNAATEPSPEAS